MNEQTVWDRAAVAVLGAGGNVQTAVSRANGLIEARRARVPFPIDPCDGAPIGALRLSERTADRLRKANILTMGDLQQLTHAQLRRIHGIGHMGPNEVVMALAAAGLGLREDPAGQYTDKPFVFGEPRAA